MGSAAGVEVASSEHGRAKSALQQTDALIRTDAGQGKPVMLYYNNRSGGRSMAHHHHHPGQAHPSPSISPSLMRLSVAERLAVAAALIALMWAAALWAMS